MYLTFYVIEVKILPQTGRDIIVYRAEDGCHYERQHGSTVNIDSLERDKEMDCHRCGGRGHKADNCPLPSSLRCHRCGETGHKASQCTTTRNRNKVTAQHNVLILIYHTQASATPPAFCYECEEFGHCVRLCPALM